MSRFKGSPEKRRKIRGAWEAGFLRMFAGGSEEPPGGEQTVEQEEVEWESNASSSVRVGGQSRSGPTLGWALRVKTDRTVTVEGLEDFGSIGKPCLESGSITFRRRTQTLWNCSFWSSWQPLGMDRHQRLGKQASITQMRTRVSPRAVTPLLSIQNLVDVGGFAGIGDTKSRSQQTHEVKWCLPCDG